MKSLRVFLCLLAVGALMTACEKDNAKEIPALSADEQFKIELKEEFEEYVSEHGTKIEYTTLDEMNRMYLKYGLEPVTLDELNITEEEYNIAQERVNNSNIAQSRGDCTQDFSKCPFPASALAVFTGDLSNNGALSTFDIIKAKQQWINKDCDGVPCVGLSTAYASFDITKFGWFTSAPGLWPPLNGLFDNDKCDDQDVWIAQRIILGLYPCDEQDCFN